MNKFALSICVVSALAISSPVQAQDNWWNAANKALNSDAGKQAVEALTRSQTTTATATTQTNQATVKATTIGAGSALNDTQISAGLKEALKVGTQTVVKQLGKDGGFSLDPAIKIPLPAPLARVDGTLKKMGMGGLTADLESRMNRAAEIATPKAGALFVNAIQKMTVKDAQAILSGSNDSATQYLRKTMGPDLAKEIQPIIQKSMADAGAIKAYDAVTAQYAKMPLASSLKTNMNDYVTNKALDGIFYYVAQEEAAIRANPAKRTTDILKKVFGSVLN